MAGLNALYDTVNGVNGGGDVWVNDNCFRIVGHSGEGGFSYIFLDKEVITDTSNLGVSMKFKDSSHISDDGTYAMNNVLIQNNEQLELVKEDIRVSSLFTHPNLLPLLDHTIIAVKQISGEIISWEEDLVEYTKGG